MQVVNVFDDAKARHVFIDVEPQKKAKTYFVDSPLQMLPLATQIAWDAVLLEMKIVGEGPFRKMLEEAHRAAHLLLSDAADFGCQIAKNAYATRHLNVKDGMQLKGAFANVPAIIVGAGPSLEINGHLLKNLQNRSLIFAGGTALKVIPARPHFAGAIDKEFLKDNPHPTAPLFFQHRMHPKNFTLFTGEKILFPDSHYEFLQRERFDSGWTVGTFLTAVATLMGCSPIVFVGMDFCYKEGKKYANQKKLETCKTPADWIMAKNWMEEWADRHPNIEFLNATEGGVPFAKPIELQNLDLAVRKIDVNQMIQALPNAPKIDWDAWKKSLSVQGEWAYEKLLLPLWNLWSPLFLRALKSDPHPEKIEINQKLFFQKVIEEHLHVF